MKFEMLAKTKIQKLKIKLEKIQAASRVRNLSIGEIVEAIAIAEDAMKNVPHLVRTEVEFIYCPFFVANAYRYPAVATQLTVRFSRKRKAIWADVDRVYLNGYKNGLRLPMQLVHDSLLKNEFGVDVANFADDEDKYNSLVKIILRGLGFNHNGYRDIT